MTVHLHHDTSAATAEEGADRRTRRFVWPAVAAIAAVAGVAVLTIDQQRSEPTNSPVVNDRVFASGPLIDSYAPSGRTPQVGLPDGEFVVAESRKQPADPAAAAASPCPVRVPC